MPPIRSHAKINWHLEVVRRRPDGYHDLRTIFQTIELADELEVERAGSGIELEVAGGGTELAADRTNLAWRAAELYRERFGDGDAGVRIRLRKRIPIGAGLGGGSSNAAAVLAALALSDGRDPASDELIAAAAVLGADVPFFLVGGVAAGLGRGDVIRALADPRAPAPAVWLAVPPFAVSTREVFERHRVGSARVAGLVLERALAGEVVDDPSTFGGWNDLEETCFALHPLLGEVYTSLTVWGAEWVRLAGSGGTICALFTDARVAERLEGSFPTDSAGSVRDSSDGARGGSRQAGDVSRGADVEITDVRVYPVQDEKVQAFVSIVFDRCFMVNDIKIIRGKDGLFVSMPSRKRKNGDFKDVAHPLNSETRRWVEDRILGTYRSIVGGEAQVVENVPSPDTVGQPTPSPLAAAPAPEPSRPKSLEEVERHHLGDSFWGVS